MRALAVGAALAGAALLGSAAPAGAQARERSGTWSARAATGLTLGGTWTAVPDSAGATVTGTWTLVDGQGRQTAGGAWSAAKAATRWNGSWRSVVAGRSGEFAGTWTADLASGGDAPFPALFERAARAVVSGGWRTGGLTGAWSIRAAEAAPGG
ncbi:hypothetical protein [Roseisolibacter sp. H3M3-2]|uniref:hypothetical protein n=1 Tax=Roseisolibacter sp. H3M3-2 TaxID=3031323 RepID=UPI0023DB1492|nr:hypothetical protein [Roseisolibacter sp. H3M3-2]MDF1505182.1 hypothetical protein [Roseisolibacter sp. H3M3-2]